MRPLSDKKQPIDKIQINSKLGISVITVLKLILFAQYKLIEWVNTMHWVKSF